MTPSRKSSKSSAQPRSASTKVHRVNVNFSEGAYAALTDLAERSDRTISQVLRDAIGLEKWWQDTIDSGGRVLVERNGVALEVIVR